MSPVVYPGNSRWQQLRAWKWWTAVGLLVLAAVAGYLVTWLIVPPPTMPGHVVVPALRGLPADEASTRLRDLGLLPRLGEEVEDPGVSPGLVSWQSPVAETQLPKGTVVQLGLSGGPPALVVPDLESLDLLVATRIIKAAGLGVGLIDTIPNNADTGVVVRSRPSAGAAIRVGGLVALTVSGGP